MMAHKVLWLALLCVVFTYAARIQYANSCWRPSLYAREASYRYVLGNGCTRGTCVKTGIVAAGALAGVLLTPQQQPPVTGNVGGPFTNTGTGFGGPLPSMTLDGSSALAVVQIGVSPPPPFSSARSNIDTSGWLVTSITVDSLHNYEVTRANQANYGLTGLIKVTRGGNFAPGTFFLFPGANPRGSGSEQWNGQLPKVNGQGVNPLPPPSVAGQTQHQLLVKLLGLEATDFIGFSVRLRVGIDGSIRNEVGTASGTCNIHYFNNRILPTAWENYVVAVIRNATGKDTIAV
jgi:hypothetical protein